MFNSTKVSKEQEVEFLKRFNSPERTNVELDVDIDLDSIKYELKADGSINIQSLKS